MASKTKKVKEMESSGGGFAGKLVAFLLGLFLGIILPIAGVAVVAITVIKKPIKDTVNMVDASGNLYNTLFDATTGFLDPYYADKTVELLLGDTVAAATALANNGSLSELAKLSPKVSEAVDNLLKETDIYGLPLEKEEIMSKPMADIFPYVKDSISNAPLGNLMQGLGGQEITNSLLLTICFGAPSHYEKERVENNTVYNMKQITYVYEDKNPDDEDDTKILYDIGGGKARGVFDDAAKTLTLDDDTVYYLSLDETATEKETYLAFSDEGKTQPIRYEATTLATITKNTDSLIDDIFLCDAMGIKNVNGTHSVLVSLAYGAEGTDYTTDASGNITPINSPRTIGELKHDNENLLNSILLKDALGINGSSHKIFISLAYGKEGKDYEIVGGQINPLPGGAAPRSLGDLTGDSASLINEISLADILAPDSESTLSMYLFYGRENVHYALDSNKEPILLEKKIAVIENGANGKAYNEWGERLTGTVDPENKTYTVDGVTYKYAPLPTGSPVTKVDTSFKNPDGTMGTDGEATLYLLTDLEGKSVGTYEAATIGSLSGGDAISNVTTRLTLGELLGKETENNFFLKHIKDETISSLPSAINELTINQVFENDIYEKDDVTDEFLTDANGNRIAKGTWKYLLKDENGDIGEYKLQQIGLLVQNMSNNVQTASLNELKNDGLFQVKDSEGNDDEGALVTPLPTTIRGYTPPAGKSTLGELNINELFTLVNQLLKQINAIPL